MNRAASLSFGLLLATFTYFGLAATGQTHSISIVAAITVLCALWWALEPIPIPVTSLVPLALFPLLGILSKDQIAQALGHQINLLLLGGFVLSLAMEKSNAHLSLAERLLQLLAGGRSTLSGKRVLVGFMLVSAGMSMWISNTASTIMLLPVALVVARASTKDNDQRLIIPLLLGICYAASIGGLGTPIGTPPNLIFISIYEEQFGKEISFITWMRWALPVVVIMLPIAIWWLSRRIDNSIELTLSEPSSLTSWQKRVLLVFLATALLWIFRTEPFGGWRLWLNLPAANDSSVALLAIIAMSLIPRGGASADAHKPLFTWDFAKDLPWGILLLFSGGIAIAIAFKVSGLSQLIADVFVSAAGILPIIGLIAIIALTVTFLTEITSNTATASLLMPVLAAIAVGSGVDGLILMLPAVLSTSFAFMMPVATAPNAVVFGSGRVPISSMIRYGFVLNILGAMVVFTYAALMLT